jgi:hypothetical protein
MINIDYSNGQIRITTENLSQIFKEDELPLKFQIKKTISKELVWETHLTDNMWASYGENEINDVVVYDAKGRYITQHYWDVVQHGSIFYKSLWLYCKNLINQGKRPKGLVVGTHDGEFGEWVPLVRNFMSDMVLVEGSKNQYDKLVQNYSNRQGLKFIFDIVTPNGEEVEFFEGGKGYTNSVVERVIRSWEKEDIHSTIRKSVSINELIENNFTVFNEKLDWIHLDVEGLDVKLLLSLKDEHIPNFIIFEDYNLSDDDRVLIQTWIEKNKFKKHSEAGICMLNKFS